MYIANDYNTFETCLQFSSTYLDAKASKYSPINQQLVYELYKANYIDNMQTLHLTPQGLHYDLCFWSYWLHKAIYPGSVSLAFTIVANIALFYMDLCQDAYEELNVIDSILYAIQEACLNLEMKSEYYNTKEPSTLKISE